MYSLSAPRSSSAATARLLARAFIGLWALLFVGALSAAWSFSRSLRVRASEHGGGPHGSRSLAEADAPLDAHHARASVRGGAGAKPHSDWTEASNLAEAAAGRVRFGPPAAAPAPFREFCNDPEEDIYVAPGPAAWQPISYPMPAALLRGEAVSCAWVRLDYDALANKNLTLCTYDPAVDTVISAALHREGKWVGVNEWDGLVAAGMCSARRPFVIDVGAGFGSFALMAASAGCHVIVIEPHAPNLARAMESFAVNGLLARGTFLLNAVHRRAGAVLLGIEPHNPGAVRIVRQSAQREETLEQAPAAAMELRGFFTWAGRPRHPGTGFRVAPGDVAVLRADTEGHVLAVLDSAKELLAAGTPPVVNLHFYAALTRNGIGCSSRRFLDFGYDTGFKMYLLKELWSREQWYDYLAEQTWSCQPMLVHRSIGATLGAAISPFDSLDVDLKPSEPEEEQEGRG